MMNSIRIIFLAFIVSGMFLIFAIPSSQNASGFETQGAKGFDVGLPIHQDITRDGLNFLKPGPLNSIVSQHVKIEQYPASPNHFDNCQFSETVNRINARYYAAVEYLNPQNPNLPLAEENFGYILHAAQDFYSHTNWVDMGRTDLIDPWLGYWHPLNSYTVTNNTPPVLILEEDGKPYYDFQIYTHGKTITVNHEMWDADGTGKKMGLISGTYDADVSKCPPSASIPHGGAISTIEDRLYSDESRVLPDELNKDNPARQGFGSARILAVAQTTHEFCRLVDLAKQKYGDKGVQFINSNWVQDQYLIDSPSNNSRCPASQTQIGSNLELPVNEINNSTILFGDLNEQCQTNYGAGAYYDKTQNTCLPPSGDWSNPGNDYLTMQCQNNYGASSYYNSTQNVCLPLSDSWSNPGDDYLTMQCQNNYGPDTYYDKTQNACLPPSGSWVALASTPENSTNENLKSLYQISKQYEKAASSLLTLNDYQTKVLSGLTAKSWYTNSDQKKTVHAQALDLMIQKQSVDKKNIQQVLDGIKEISDKIRGYAQNQGTDPSILDQIDSETQNNVPTTSASPTTLKQVADAEKTDVSAVEKVTNGLTQGDKMELTNQLSKVLGGDESILEKFRGGELSSLDVASMQSLLAQHASELTEEEIAMLKLDLKNFGFEVPSTDDLGRMQQTIDSLHNQEQNQTDSILNYITDTGMLELSPIENTPIQLQSKHGSYEPVGNSDTYLLYGSWMLKSQNGMEYKVAKYHIFSSTNTGFNIQGDAKIEEGEIRAFSGDIPIPPGTWFLELLTIDGNLSPPQDSRIEVVIPSKVSSETPSTVQTTPIVPTTPLTQIPLDFTVPSQVVQEATSSSGAIVHFTISASSPGGNTGIVTCVPSDGSQFPLGSTTVTCTATDMSNQKTLKKSFTVIVQDTTPPAISPFNPHNDTPDDSGAIVYFTTEAIDLVDGQVTVHCDHQSGTKFPFGTTVVTCTADDSKGNHSERKLGITITKS